MIDLEFADPADARLLAAAIADADVAVIGDPAAPAAVLLSPRLFQLLAADIAWRPGTGGCP